MNENKLVSVVTATYNMGNYLKLAIDSVLQQTYKNIEIIVVDDGSTDNTDSVMSNYINDKRVKYLPQKQNKGQTISKNIGLKSTNGEYIAFIDADNIWLPNKLELQLPYFDLNKKIGVVYSDLELIDDDGVVLPSKKRIYHSGNITKQLLLNNFVNFNSAVIKKECIDKVGIFNEQISMGIDWDLWLRISVYFDFYFVNKKTYYYRIWKNQMSHNKQKRLNCALIIVQNFKKDFPEVVNNKIINKSLARIYNDFANDYKNKNNRLIALKYYLKALLNDLYYLNIYKNLIKMLIGKK